MLHEFFLALQLADKTIEHLIATAGCEEWVGVALARLKDRCKHAFAQKQQRESQRRRTDYVSEICDASADLALSLEQGIWEEKSGIVISLGNSEQRLAVDVLLDQDVVEGQDAGAPVLRGPRSLRRRVLIFQKWNVVQVRIPPKASARSVL